MFDDFYFVVENPYLLKRKGKNVSIDPGKICVLQSILKTYNNKNKCFSNHFPEIFGKVKKLMMDSGGYNILKMYPDYPFSVREYHEQLEFIKPDYGVCMDYNTAALMDIIGDKYKDRLPYMKKTIDQFLLQFDMDRSYELVIPIQGNTIDEKLEFVDMLGERIDLEKVEYWGVGGGGITGMDNSSQNYFIEIRRSLCIYLNKKFNHPKIHIFGGNITFLKDVIRKNFIFTSVDTWSWGIPMKKGRTFDENLESILIRKSGLTMTEAKQRCMLKYLQEVNKIKKLLAYESNINKLI